MIAAADLVVLDVHGVVFTRAFPEFVHRRALDRREDPDEVWWRWRHEYRLDLWEGRITPEAMWRGLFPGDDPQRLSADVERGYGPGPLFEQIERSDQTLWLLSNHRSEWLLPRLARFGIADRFERVLVSDRLGAAKPDVRAFAPLLDAGRHRTVCFIDDSPRNVAAARRLGIDARLLDAA